MVTQDAYTLTDGPSIYMANDINKVAKTCIKMANIPQQVMKDINESILFNNKLNDELRNLEQSYQDIETKLMGNVDQDLAFKSKKAERITSDEHNKSSNLKTLKKKIDDMRSLTKIIKLHDMFVPNRKEHLNKWAEHGNYMNPFTCNISENHIIKIMELDDVNDSCLLYTSDAADE